MKSAPTYGIIGNGRMSRHMQHYFTSLQIAFQVWERSHPEDVESALKDCDVFLVLINDDAIEGFHQDHSFLRDQICIHFSGALTLEGVQGMHPLFNFTDDLYDQEVYAKIPFVVEEGAHSFEEIFPVLPNPHVRIPADPVIKAKYHALCVIAGNFPTLLWQETASELKAMGLNPSIMHPYIQNIAKAYTMDPNDSLTGPFARKDDQTINKNLEAVSNTSLESIYQAFKEAFR